MADPQTLAAPDLKPLETSPMAEVPTPASPDASAASTKKKRKKKNSEERGAATAPAAAATDTLMANPDPSSASTKEKRKKKKKNSEESEAVDAAPAAAENPMADPDPSSASTKEKRKKKKKSSEESEADNVDAAPAPEKEEGKNSKDHEAVDAAAATTPEKKKKKKNKKHKAPEPEPEPVTVTVDVSRSAAAAAAPPVVAYFPSGYNPLAAGSEPPSARLFRHAKHPNRVDLVVRSPGGGPDFVGKSYDGEAAMPQLCNYALGVLDKASGTIKVVPIASDKILRLEPYIEVQKPMQSQHSSVTEVAGSDVAAGDVKVQELTIAYGSKKDKDTDKKWKSLIEQQNDPSAYMDLDLGQPETNASTSDNQAPVIVRNIPPYDPTADTSETAYRFDEIIPKNLRSHLLEILGHLESGEFSSKGYGTFVSNRVNKLEELQGEDKERLAWILSYITHLLTLLARSNSMSKRYKKADLVKAPAVPPAVHRKLLVMFTEEGSGVLSTEKKELLINYILVLTLFADDFRSDPEDICADLKMTRVMLKPYYQQLGCKSVAPAAFKAHVMTLPAPLKFPDNVGKRKRRN